MKRIIKTGLTFLFSLVLFTTILVPSPSILMADEYTSIQSVKDLLAMKDNPSGNYRLEEDINMDGIEWTPFLFTGKLDGNHHSILNLNLKQVGSDSAITYDGNMKTYDTHFAGLFSQIVNGSVENLTLCNVRADVKETKSCFVGSIAGFTENALIKGCNITGQLSLTIDAPMFGVGGIVGYGNGKIDSCTTNTTIICIDTNKAERDEQFMGGAFAGGYLDVDNCDIHIEGYDSDHGYVHNGGVAGIYIFYPQGKVYRGSISHNKVSGFITFFEDNTNRRAYCKAYVGECMTWEYDFIGNGSEELFKRDERFDYSKDLLPNMCENPTYTSVVTVPTATDFGFTTYKCSTCDYTYTDHYKALKNVEDEKKAEEAAKKEAEEASQKAASSEEINDTAKNSSGFQLTNYVVLIIILVILLILLIVFLLRYNYVKKRRHHIKKRKR